MATNGNNDKYSDAPTFQVDDKNNKGQAQFGNTVFGVDAVETSVASGVSHQGWVRRVAGTGPIASFVINDGGADYANDDTIDVEGGTGANAVGTIVTDANGTITSIAVTTDGAGFTGPGSATLTVNTSAGTGANVEVTTGGRSGRVSYETLSTARIIGDATSFANTGTANTTGTADDTLFPDS
jgi:hypothetical protein